MSRPLLTLLLFAALPLSAAVFYEMDTTETRSCTFSSRYHNRIVVSGGTIKKIMCPEGHLSITMEGESGQAFIQATPTTPNPAILSVITSQGLVQDLEITFEDRPTEVVILSEPKDTEETPPADAEEALFSNLSHTIDQILKHGCPGRFSWKPIYGHPCKLKSGVTLSLGYKIICSDTEIRVFHLHNPTKRPKQVRQSEITVRGGEWVYIETPYLQPGQHTRVLVGHALTERALIGMRECAQ